MGRSLIIDGHNTTYRTFWTAKTQSQGDEEKLDGLHIHFTLNAIKSYAIKFNPDNIYCTWDKTDGIQKKVRKELHTEYKGNRSSDQNPHRNNDKIVEFLDSLGIPSLYPRELEADDIVAYLTHNLSDHKVIVSVDKDFLQLVSKDVRVYDPIRKKETYQHNFEENVKCKYEDFMTIKCLSGDASDNVQGIPKFGPVKIKKFLDGEITLNPEEQAIFDRNYNLFRLDRWKESSDKEFYTEQLNSSTWLAPDYKKFQTLCEEQALNQILSKKEEWHSLFFMKYRLKSLFA